MFKVKHVTLMYTYVDISFLQSDCEAQGAFEASFFCSFLILFLLSLDFCVICAQA